MKDNYNIKKAIIVAIVSVLFTRLIDIYIYNLNQKGWVYNIAFFVIYILTYFIYSKIREIFN